MSEVREDRGTGGTIMGRQDQISEGDVCHAEDFGFFFWIFKKCCHVRQHYGG